jgi:hypothetical protein
MDFFFHYKVTHYNQIITIFLIPINIFSAYIVVTRILLKYFSTLLNREFIHLILPLFSSDDEWWGSFLFNGHCPKKSVQKVPLFKSGMPTETECFGAQEVEIFFYEEYI